jgi:hypothetical protein
LLWLSRRKVRRKNQEVRNLLIIGDQRTSEDYPFILKTLKTES